MARAADIVVVGAGISGVATARAIARSGRAVLLLERFALGHARGSSHGSSRIFRLNYPDNRYVRLAQGALAGWRELESESGSTLVSKVGALDLGVPALDNARALAACGVRFETLSGAEASRRWPIGCDPDEPALFQPDGGVIDAAGAFDALVAGARAAAVEIRDQSRVVSLEAERSGVQLHMEAGTTIGCDAVVLTAGAWSSQLVEPLDLELAVVPTRETVVYLELANAEAIPPLIDYARLPAPGAAGLVRNGQAGYALAAPGIGLKAGLHHAGAVTDPDADPPPDRAIAEWTLSWARGRYRNAGAELGAETCIYTNTSDEGFVLERYGRVIVGSACSGHGFKFAPQIGKTLAALAIEAAQS